MKSDKIILTTIFIIIICIIAIIGIIYIINKNNDVEEDEIREQSEAGIEYSTSQLDNFEFKITNMDSNVKSKIPSYDTFTLKMKEYIYKNGLVQASIAEFVDFKNDNNDIILNFKLNNPKQTILTAKINLKDKTYTFSDNYNI